MLENTNVLIIIFFFFINILKEKNSLLKELQRLEMY